jgi:single-stranded-DNA-specific exonuclease
VAFYVLGRLAWLRETDKSACKSSPVFGLVALGTLQTLVLDKNNRILVHHGLAALSSKRCCLGTLDANKQVVI